ncbi:hypothetical protein PV08_01421 [Exophiala spinifera]|uniref:Uncharacterized protein n=1 Tax=Exophiala spinifera TaxID=91928 RepID=A0A0D2BPH2_9EURO|nr:uncharacterized protein PV08_01421 [Exophiala spinifera]KIW20843.1 hypothetical protein PV08_01421 [Exophiala spinifera]
MGPWKTIIFAAYALSGHSWAAVVPFIPPADQENNLVAERDLHNANHIFNAIHSSMRQWGSSLNHNGMSFFMAQVPAGTQFYHGTGFQQPVEGMEWLAFEPEHASYFARRLKRPNDTEGSEVKTGDRIQLAPTHDGGMVRQVPVQEANAKRPRYEFEPGWLHTYRTKDALPLLYIDGMSAAKAEVGTLDSQDVLLLNVTRDERHGFWDYERARRLCKLADENWHGKVKGFIRMEAGFEIILCSFVENVDIVSAVRTGPSTPDGDEPDPNDPIRENIMVLIKAISARYDGIGGGRVLLDYNNFVTSYAYDLELFNNGGDLPRLENLSVASLDKVRNDVDAMVTNWEPSDSNTVNWQSIADMVVERYANELQYLVSDMLITPQAFFYELSTVLRVFIDSDNRNSTTEVERCVNQFVPTRINSSASIAGRAIDAVTRRICSSLFAAFDGNVSVSESKANLRSLMTYLDWTTWKKCGDCALDEVCFIPVWPYGAEEDRRHPRCRNATEIGWRQGGWQWSYWI